MFHHKVQLRSLLHGIACAAVLIIAQTAYCQPATPSLPAKGQIVESVASIDNPNQTYALYLPSNYTATRSWPILISLDPSAHGSVPVEHFKEAAEQYGWIVVGSNSSRNGPLAPTTDAMNAIWRDLHQRFAVDDRR